METYTYFVSYGYRFRGLFFQKWKPVRLSSLFPGETEITLTEPYRGTIQRLEIKDCIISELWQQFGRDVAILTLFNVQLVRTGHSKAYDKWQAREDAARDLEKHDGVIW